MDTLSVRYQRTGLLDFLHNSFWDVRNPPCETCGKMGNVREFHYPLEGGGWEVHWFHNECDKIELD